MQARLTNPAALLPETVKAINMLYRSAHAAGVPATTLELVHLRASQINGCGPCVDSGARNARKNGETEERLSAVAVWRETPYFTDAERAALALAELLIRACMASPGHIRRHPPGTSMTRPGGGM